MHDYEVICDHTNNSQEDIDNNMLNTGILLNFRPVVQSSDIDWAIVGDEVDQVKLDALGISPHFLASGEMVVVPTATDLADRLQEYHDHLTKSLHIVRCGYLKPIAVRGGALLRHNGLKFRSLRLARQWWKTNMLNNPDFDADAFIPKGQLGTIYGTTMITEGVKSDE